MDIKQILAMLLANADKIQDQDAGLLADMVASYGIEPEAPETEETHEAQETPETEALEHETGQELGEPLGEVKETPEPNGEAVEEPIVEEGQVQEGEPVVEDQPAPAPDPMEAVLSEITNLRSEIEALKTSLSKVAVREEVGEDEEEDGEIGARSKPANAQQQQNDIQEALLAKFGGRAK